MLSEGNSSPDGMILRESCVFVRNNSCLLVGKKQIKNLLSYG